MENSEEIFDLAQKLDEKGVRVRVGKHRFHLGFGGRRLNEYYAQVALGGIVYYFIAQMM
mgnify:CR=1 FL=1